MRAMILSMAVGMCLTGFASVSSAAEDQMFKGKVVAVMDGKLMVSDAVGQNMQTYAVSAGSKVTLNGKDVSLTDLMEGDNLTLTLDGLKVKSIAAMRSRKT